VDKAGFSADLNNPVFIILPEIQGNRLDWPLFMPIESDLAVRRLPQYPEFYAKNKEIQKKYSTNRFVRAGGALGAVGANQLGADDDGLARSTGVKHDR
jgi:hypothetical protein